MDAYNKFEAIGNEQINELRKLTKSINVGFLFNKKKGEVGACEAHELRILLFQMNKQMKFHFSF